MAEQVEAIDFGARRLRRCRHGWMLYLKSDQVIGAALDVYGEFAESENRLMAALIKPGDVVLDVGANIGTVALALARRVGPSGRVYAFEPQRIVFQLLCANVGINAISNIDARWLAVGAAAGQTHIPILDPEAPANFGEVATATSGEAVTVAAIDDLRLEHCSLIKIDVEGMESEVLRGAEQTIARHRPSIYFEAKRGENTRSCIDWLMQRQYRLYWHFAYFFDPANFRKVEQNLFDNRGDINAVAVPHNSAIRPRLPSIARPDCDWQEDYTAWQATRS
jgi:FkbM family methyltransferase